MRYSRSLQQFIVDGDLMPGCKVDWKFATSAAIAPPIRRQWSVIFIPTPCTGPDRRLQPHPKNTSTHFLLYRPRHGARTWQLCCRATRAPKTCRWSTMRWCALVANGRKTPMQAHAQCPSAARTDATVTMSSETGIAIPARLSIVADTPVAV